MSTDTSLRNHDLAIPKTIDDVSADWLSTALGVTVAATTQERIGEGVGLVGELARVHLSYANPADANNYPATMIAKAHTRAADMLPIAAFYGLYTTEVGFYQDASAGFGVRTPKCFYADASADGMQCIILLEDLAGAVAVDQIAGCPIDRAEVVIDALATMHGGSWGRESLKDMAWLRPFNNPAYLSVGDQIKAGLPIVLSRYSDLEPDAIAAAELLAEHVPAMYSWTVENEPLTISHTDLRLDNLFFDLPDGSPLAILDWQLTVRAGGSFDVSYFICQSLTIEDRRAHEERLVRRWHEGLLAAGVQDYSFEKAWYDYRFAIGFQFGISVSTGLYAPVNDHAAKLMDVIVHRNFTAAHEHDTLGLIKAWLAEHAPA
jgi:Ecdysteroid kinase-like family